MQFAEILTAVGKPLGISAGTGAARVEVNPTLTESGFATAMVAETVADEVADVAAFPALVVAANADRVQSGIVPGDARPFSIDTPKQLSRDDFGPSLQTGPERQGEPATILAGERAAGSLDGMAGTAKSEEPTVHSRRTRADTPASLLAPPWASNLAYLSVGDAGSQETGGASGRVIGVTDLPSAPALGVDSDEFGSATAVRGEKNGPIAQSDRTNEYRSLAKSHVRPGDYVTSEVPAFTHRRRASKVVGVAGFVSALARELHPIVTSQGAEVTVAPVRRNQQLLAGTATADQGQSIDRKSVDVVAGTRGESLKGTLDVHTRSLRSEVEVTNSAPSTASVRAASLGVKEEIEQAVRLQDGRPGVGVPVLNVATAQKVPGEVESVAAAIPAANSFRNAPSEPTARRNQTPFQIGTSSVHAEVSRSGADANFLAPEKAVRPELDERLTNIFGKVSGEIRTGGESAFSGTQATAEPGHVNLRNFLHDEPLSVADLPLEDAPQRTIAEGQSTNDARRSEASPRWSEAVRPVATQIGEAIRQTSDGRIDIKLSPEELGRVRLSMTSTDAGMSVTILAERPETADLMRRHVDILAQELKAQGHHNLSFEFSDHGPSDMPNWGDENADASPEHADVRDDLPEVNADRRLIRVDGRLDMRI